jgi:hypothetical protein
MRQVAERPKGFQLLGVSPKPAWAEVWHLWRVILPRRSISGRLVRGQVWRRHDGRRWIYKKFIQPGADLTIRKALPSNTRLNVNRFGRRTVIAMGVLIVLLVVWQIVGSF